MIAPEAVFDLNAQGYTAWHAALLPAACGAGVLLLCILAAWRGALRRPESRWWLLLAGIASAIGLVTSGALVSWTWREYSHLTAALNGGQVTVVEGVVRHFVPEGKNGHPIEQFDVDGKHFAYSSSTITSGFHHTAGTGGPIRAGIHVRITSVDRTIVRVEIGH